MATPILIPQGHTDFVWSIYGFFGDMMKSANAKTARLWNMAETNLQLNRLKYRWYNNYQMALDRPSKETKVKKEHNSTQKRKTGATKMLENFWPHCHNSQAIAAEFSGS